MALAGDVEPLVALAEEDSGLAYKWLCLAADQGSEEAAGLVEDLLEASDLRYDDDGFITGQAHFELGLAYLTGADGVPVDAGRAEEYLRNAAGYPHGLEGGDEILASAREPLDPAQREIFDRSIATE